LVSEFIERLYNIDEEKTLSLLREPIYVDKIFFIKDFKNARINSQLTCLEFEASSKLMHFSHPAINECLDSFWYDKILRKNDQWFNTWFKVIFFLFLHLSRDKTGSCFW
jgi:hypothetical protein